jgi:hypothetical protein
MAGSFVLKMSAAAVTRPAKTERSIFVRTGKKSSGSNKENGFWVCDVQRTGFKGGSREDAKRQNDFFKWNDQKTFFAP